MARYDFTCPEHGTFEHVCGMAEVEETEPCPECGQPAQRIFQVPAAIHFKGPGFYATDVTGRLHRKRRKNPGDDLPKEFDHDAARIAAGI
jgi:putative FmdB family regulatory protein